MTTSFKLLAAATLLAGTGLAQAAPISIFSHTINNPAGGSFDGVKTAGGEVKSISTTYDETHQTFSWSYTVAPGTDRDGNPNGNVNDAFWLVVSDGPDPKYDLDEYAILFGDLDTKRLTAYLYNGRNSSTSWDDPGVLLASYDVGELEVTPGTPGSGTKTVSFDIDVASINGYSPDPDPSGAVLDSFGEPWDAEQWDGISFGEKLGIWFHPTAKTTVEYNGAELDRFAFKGKNAGYYDGKEITVSQVPEPSMLYLAGVGLLGFALSRRLGGDRRRQATGDSSTRLDLAAA